MIKDIDLRAEPRHASDNEVLLRHAAKALGIERQRIGGVVVTRRSVDARKKMVVINLRLRVFIDEPAPRGVPTSHIAYEPLPSGAPSAIVVGAGPAGLFAALRLIELGVKPIVLERGKPVDERRVDVARISREGVVDPDSNYCFGEGGAGAFSDGKLYTRSKKRGSVERILNIFHQHGASDSILVDAHPHIGSDKLPAVITAMRGTIESCGGEVRFGTRVAKVLLNDERSAATGVVCADGTQLAGPIILATGHSARDVYHFLNNAGIALEPKGIAVGVRLEHPQHLIDQIQYHSDSGRGQWLPPAEYSFVTQVDGRGVYSFCMCPGGVIVPAASAPHQLVVNGMSPSSRGTYWANSGMVVEMHPEDLPQKYDKWGVLKMMMYQENLERKCFEWAGRSQVATAQRMRDFVDGKPSRLIPPSSFAPGVQGGRVDALLPPFVSKRLKKAFKVFGRNAKGFLTNDAVVIGVETRTSSPVRVPRDASSMCHVSLAGLYPCGEGAGYAGGIVSSAIDGERCAEALAAAMANAGQDTASA